MSAFRGAIAGNIRVWAKVQEEILNVSTLPITHAYAYL